MRSNKRSKILNASAQGRNEHKNRITKTRKRKYTEFTANSENEQNIDESKALEHKKRRLLLQQDVNSVLKMEKTLEPQEMKTDESKNVQIQQMANRKAPKRKRNEIQDSNEINASEMKNDTEKNEKINNESDFGIDDSIEQHKKRRRYAVNNVNDAENTVFNPIQEHRCDCPFVQSHQYLGQSMVGWEYCSTILAKYMNEFIETLTK